MNTNPTQLMTVVRGIVCSVLISCAVLCGGTPSARAEIPAPDNILYGTITLTGNLVTAGDTDVSVEARRMTNGPAIASYRMGSEAVATNFYVLRLPVEELSQPTDTNASLVGDTVYLVVKVGNMDDLMLTYTFPERGVAQRIDFGLAPAGPDSDGDGLSDAWELAKFGSLTNGFNSPAGNGRTAGRNFFEGTDTNSFILSITESNNQTLVYFFGRKAEGVGYSNYSRYYLLETSTNLNGGLWLGVPGFTNVLGNNQIIQYGTNAAGPAFFRGQVRLGSQ